MRKNAPRKWLHAILDLLPVILIPVFMIYSHRHTIDSCSIQVPQNEVVDFNQLVSDVIPHDFTSFSSEKINNYTLHFYSNTRSRAVNQFQVTNDIDCVSNHIYYISGSHYVDDLVTNSVWGNNGVDYIISPFIDDFLITIPSNISNIRLYTFIDSSVTNLNFIISYKIIDLTQMFGSGNEPTLQQFNQWYTDVYYDYTLSTKQLLRVGSTTFDDTDIMSQSMYQLYNAIDKYFNMNNVFNMGNVYDWFNINIFNGNAPIIMYIVWNIALYELVMDLMFLLYALFMWFVDWCKSLIEKTYDTGRGK